MQTLARESVVWHLSTKRVLPLARDSLTLVLHLLEELLRNTFCGSSDDHAAPLPNKNKKKNHRLDPAMVQQRWQALFPHYPELARLGDDGVHLIMEDEVSAVLWADGLPGQDEVEEAPMVARYCARALLAVAARIGSAAASAIRLTQPSARSLPPAAIRKAIHDDPSLASVFKDSRFLWIEPQSLAAQCATIVVEHELPYHYLDLPDDVIEVIEKKDKVATMRRLLGRIDAILTATLQTPLKLDPVTNKEILAVEQKFRINFPPELRVFLMWNDGVPSDAPGMDKFVKCASLAEIYEAFFYKFDFARLMRWMEWIPIAPVNFEFSYYALDIESGHRMVVRIDDFDGLETRLVALSFIDGVRAYVDALERHKDKLEALKPREEDYDLGDLRVEERAIFSRLEPALRRPNSLFANPSVLFDGSEGEEDDYCNSSSDDDRCSDDGEDNQYDDGEFRLNMGRLKRHKLAELRLFVKKYDIAVFGRMKDDLVDAITSWKRRQEEEDSDSSASDV